MKTATTLHLAKENFKFSSAHFLIFNETEAEMLHGHNYQVKLELSCRDNPQGYAVDFAVLKKFIKARLDGWDEHVLLPEKHPDMKSKLSADQKNYEIHFRDRFYSLPVKEVIWLPVNNTSVEMLSKILADEFITEFAKYGVLSLTVFVEETRGQAASTTVSL